MADTYETFIIGTCENCHKVNVKVRPVEAISWMSKASRGWFQICFECFKPRVTFSTRRGTFHAPTDKIRSVSEEADG